MASQAVTAFSGNMKKALAGLRRIDLEGLRWRVFDAEGQVLGRLASQIATVVQGKDKPTYTPNRDDGDMCIVLNAKDVCFTGRKLTDKVYYWHTGPDLDQENKACVLLDGSDQRLRFRKLLSLKLFVAPIYDLLCDDFVPLQLDEYSDVDVTYIDTSPIATGKPKADF
ncbi:54S ribosomal protein L23 mitochondrial-like isoform X1 [Tripterygium wilfordii]|uniref:54S ribosomal protein L23 mitochondrial-like isoform X1 n=1 Tax=Tripterygium wilfordii TaxID=458696 RepID=A0A7J7CFA8_TRIWF|nr:54S ribosomal protein L23 mitochondrial-like isoform X1 [Tripterygium wilfordii]